MTTTATEAIWVRFNGKLKQFILRRVSDGDIADDILQEVFLKIHSRVDTLKDDARVHGWVYRIARNSIVDHYRKRKIEFSPPEDLPDAAGSVENEARGQLASGLRDMVAELPEPYREALDLTEFQGFTRGEMARTLGLSVSGAKARVRRGRRMLRDILLDCCHFEFDRYHTVIDYYPRCCPCCSSRTRKMK
ncbi:MAG: RNA polymerase sigma factor SigZ [Desulfobacterales bacterium]|nr:RNA polymerase sigma factor SigZ [Desulfobacterales bacterium]